MGAWCVLALALLVSHVVASERKFDVKDDIFAFPQYEIRFPIDSYLLHDEAVERLRKTNKDVLSASGSVVKAQPSSTHSEEDDGFEYEYMNANGAPYLCAIPRVEPLQDDPEPEKSEEERKSELIAAADRGWELLQDMGSNQCLYYSTGWWSYAFCYGSHVKQFHGLNYGPNGARLWPPQEDPTTPSYILGKYDTSASEKNSQAKQTKPKIGDLQTQAETTYLVQKLGEGTPCDLTGKPRRVEVQYHCSTQANDRIGWIKETTTCTYVMVILTPRLCNDVAFKPPKEARLYPIECHEILTEEEATRLKESDRRDEQDLPTINEGKEQVQMLGRVTIGGQKLVGGEGKRIERGQIVMTPDEKAEVVIMQKDGQITGLSSPELKKRDLRPEDIEAFRKELQKIAGTKDWKIERLGNVDGQIQLRGVVDDGSKAKNGKKKADDKKEAEETGSEEKFKDEV